MLYTIFVCVLIMSVHVYVAVLSVLSFGPLIGIKNFELYTSLLSSDVKYYKLKNKFEDTSFINNIKCYDIIGLVETHLVESLPAPLKNYNIHHTYRKQNVKTKRNFGGISVLIKKTIVVLKYMKIQTVTLYG